jgi:AraC family transcriptional activator of tynA and feaB
VHRGVGSLSHAARPRLDPPSRQAAEDRISPIPPSALPARGRLTSISSDGADLVEYWFDAPSVRRPPPLCWRRGGGGISIDLTDACRSIRIDNAHRSHRLSSLDAIVMDRAQPVRMECTQYRHISLVLGRQRVAESLGTDPAILAGRRLPAFGLSGLLQSHMRATIDEADDLSAEHRSIALAAAVAMATAVLRTELRAATADACVNLHQVAHRLIERTCSDPELTPAKIAATLGCSRATLYRLFGKPGASIAAAIWGARLDRASRLLGASRYQHLLVSEIALRCGFTDQPTFNRMFKRRYGVTPRESRSLVNALPGRDQ